MSNALGLEKSDGPIGGSNKSFGVMLGVIFLLATAYLVAKDKSAFAQLFTFVASVTTFVVAFKAPTMLTKPNLYWMKFSLLLARVVSPIVLGVLFFVLISPLVIVLRIFGRDQLLLKHQESSSLWKIRNSKGYPLESFKNQY